MSDHRLERLKETLLLAESVAPSRRRAWIAQQLADDPALRDECLSLNEALSDGPPLSPAVGGMQTAFPHADGVIGPYRLVGLLGSGGMANVFHAHQSAPLDRSVALKVLRITDPTGRMLRRLEAERDLLSMLEHPHIARLLDAGMSREGQLYLAVELVDGIPITEFVTLHRVDLRARIELMLQVCAGVQHAHDRGVLHRDLKPSNVLVTMEDGEPVAKVIDFGVARLLRHEPPGSRATVDGQVIGTLGYMSPEQANPHMSDVDVRSDVYSLGVIMHELIAGVRPFDDEVFNDKSSTEIFDLLRTARPPGPALRAKAVTRGTDPAGQQDVPAELDCITRKCLEPDPGHRYSSVRALADDLTRFLRGEVISARPPT
ncbi:MAG: serine/threonine protein kinase, partial [Phycisphaerales bacterium]|nr:serine/threonine protein kinase [Phycisphaerales bacterium]